MRVKKDFINRLNKSIMVFFSVFAVSISVYFFIMFTSQINAIKDSLDIIMGVIENGEGFFILFSEGLSSINFMFMSQIVIFLISIFALVASVKYTTDKYLVEKKNALIDSLTQLYNKKAILHFLKQELARSSRYGHPTTVALMDIDYFKKYNDKNGHVAGDNLLKKLGFILKKSMRDFDEVGRFGGEEFMIVFPETKISDAAKICERIREKIGESKFYGQNKMPFGKITISVGLSEVKGKRMFREKKILEKADEFLYKAKESGRNRVLYKKK